MKGTGNKTIPFDRTAQLAANGKADSKGASQLISSQTPKNVRAWNVASVYAIVRKTDAGDKHISKTATVAL